MKEQILPGTMSDYMKMFVYPPRGSLRLFKVVEGHRTLAVFGYYYLRKQNIAFCKIDKGFPAKKIYRVAKHCCATLEKCRVPLMAVADKKQSCADNFLTHLGFSYSLTSAEQDIYTWTR